MKNTIIPVPQWATLLTVDVVLPRISPELKTELLPFMGMPISLVWKRISKAARTALETWYASL